MGFGSAQFDAWVTRVEATTTGRSLIHKADDLTPVEVTAEIPGHVSCVFTLLHPESAPTIGTKVQIKIWEGDE